MIVQSAKDPNSALNLPESHKPQFASKFSDPNDPIHNGSLVTLLSNGKIVLPQNSGRRGGGGLIGGIVGSVVAGRGGAQGGLGRGGMRGGLGGGLGRGLGGRLSGSGEAHIGHSDVSASSSSNAAVSRHEQRQNDGIAGTGIVGPIGLLKKAKDKRIMRGGVLYLMIVPLPTSEEIKTAEAQVKAMPQMETVEKEQSSDTT